MLLLDSVRLPTVMRVRSADHGNSAAVPALYPRIEKLEDHMASIARRGTPVILLCLCLSSVVTTQGQTHLPAQADASSAAEKLAARLVAAGSDQERQALLAAEKELVSVELRKALIGQGEALRTKGNYPQAQEKTAGHYHPAPKVFGGLTPGRIDATGRGPSARIAAPFQQLHIYDRGTPHRPITEASR